MWILFLSTALAMSPKRVDALASKALASFNAGDLVAAAKLATRVLANNPNQPDALYVRGMTVTSVLAYGQAGDESPSLHAIADQDLRHFLQVEPNSLRASIVRSVLGVGTTLPDPVYDCTPEARAQFAQADNAFATGQTAKARRGYEQALALCPGNATWWVDRGDTFFTAGDLQAALADYEHAISIDACNWQAQRFASDALLRLDEPAQAIIHQVRAVSCNPGYEIGWSALSSTLQAIGGHLVRPARPVGTRSWEVFAKARVAATGSALERSRAAVRAATADGTGPFWTMLADADSADRLDEAIFVLLLDDALLAEFPSWQAQHPKALEAFVAGSMLDTGKGPLPTDRAPDSPH